MLCSDFIWAIAFILPYAAVFLAFAVYPVLYALWLGSRPSLYAEHRRPLYMTTVANTLCLSGSA